MKNKNLFGEYEEILEESEEISGMESKEKKAFGYNPFSLQDAVGEKNVKKTWIEYEKLRFAGIEAEELVYKIVSKTRDMLAISEGASKEDLNVKDRTYNESKKDTKNWKEEDLKNFYTKLTEIYHRSRMESNEELDIALEKILLSI